MATVSLTIDGKQVKALPGSTILEVVRKYKIAEIPTLCHDPELPPYGSCFLCVVEVQGMNKLVPSCSTPVAEGMVVSTCNERIFQTRKMALELLLSNHYADCVAPCVEGCPANVDVQTYIALISAGEYSEAVKVIREKNPLPVVCGRICVRKCELNCRRKEADGEPVGINYLKRYASDYEREHHEKENTKSKKGKKVAVIGGGPAGLTASYYLAKEGYEVTIFEMMEKLGGMLRYGIPEYRLPKKVLDQEIGFILDLGVKAKTGVRYGKDITKESLEEEGFSAVFFGVGAWSSQNMGIEGENEIEGVIPGIDYLREHQIKGESGLKGKVIVVGGGNTAIDAARTAVREKGVKKVTLLYRRTRNEMPADPLEIHGAEEEGVELLFLTAPIGFVKGKDGVLKSLKCQSMELGAPDSSGRRRPVPVKDSEFEIPCDYLISAIGQKPDLSGIGLEKTKWNTIAVDAGTLCAGEPALYAGGDAVLGPSVVIDAIAQGQKAAKSIDEFLTKGKVQGDKTKFISKRDIFGNAPEGYYTDISPHKRSKMTEEDPRERIKDEREVEKGILEEDVPKETSRCLECGCVVQDSCYLRDYATEYDADQSRFLGETRITPIDRRHPFIVLDQNKCILCGRCVRTCDEIVGRAVYGFIDRGFGTQVCPIPGNGLKDTDCIDCGNCIDVCPTGAIANVFPAGKPIPRVIGKTKSVCSFCSVGCHLFVEKHPGGSWKIGSDRNGGIDGPGKGLLCFRGRFAHEYVKHPTRVLKPMVRKNGELIQTDWQTALGTAFSGLNSKTEGRTAVFYSQKASIEEMLIIEKISETFKDSICASLSAVYSAGSELLGDLPENYRNSSADFRDLDRADIIVAFGDTEKENPVAAMRINKRESEGASLFLFDPDERGTLCKKADVSLFSEGKDDGYVFAALLNSLLSKGAFKWEIVENLTSDFSAFEESLKKWNLRNVEEATGTKRRKIRKLVDALSDPDKKTVFVMNADSYSNSSTLRLVCSYLLLTGKLFGRGSGLLLLGDHSNSTAYRLSEKNRQPAKEVKDALEKGEIRRSLIFREDPLSCENMKKFFEKNEFIVVSDFTLTETAKRADVFLPSAAHFESVSSFINAAGEVFTSDRILSPMEGMDSKYFLTSLLEMCGADTLSGEKDLTVEALAKFSPKSATGHKKDIKEALSETGFIFPLKAFAPCDGKKKEHKDVDSLGRWAEIFWEEKSK